MKKIILIIIFVPIFGFIPYYLSAQTQTPEETMKAFQQDRFGIFIHWDPRIMTMPRLDKCYRNVDVKTIFEMYKYWNPVKFNAQAWVDTFRQAGARYIVFITKHQYGFCNFDNPYTDYDVMSAPFRRDPAKALADVCHKDHMKLFWYYSSGDAGKADPYMLPMRKIKSYPEYRYKSVKYLLTHYGRIEGIWWDGGDSARNDLRDMILSVQPHIIMGPRIKFEGGNQLTWGTPEQIVGKFDMEHPWESCVPLEGNEWFYCGGKDVKPVNTVVKILTQCAGGNGNLLLNTSPMPDGTLQPAQVHTLLGVGDWLSKYGMTIYETRGGPYKPGPWGVSTRKDNKVYLQIMEINETGMLELPLLSLPVISCKALTPGQVTLKKDNNKLTIKLDRTAAHPDPVTLVVLTLSGNAIDIPPLQIERYKKSLTEDKKVWASSTISKKQSPDAVIAHSDLENMTGLMLKRFRMAKKGLPVDTFKIPDYQYTFVMRERGFRGRYWMPEENDKEPWIAVDLGRNMKIGEVYLMEKYDRIKKFELQYLNKGNWVTFYKGGTINYFSLKFDPITAQQVRLKILKSKGAPAIKMFDLFW